MKTHKGKFSPVNPSKYKGDPTNIIFRSSWELQMMKYLDKNENVLAWQSEEFFIPYIDPLDPYKRKVRRYFPDFLAKVRQADGTTKIIVMEVKPFKETQEPRVRNKKTKKYITEVANWAKNSSKWKFAKEYCADRGWEFIIITENELGLK